MDKLFDIIFLEEAFEFLKNIDAKHYEKILYNIRKAQTGHDPELFKKLNDEIWELRTLFSGFTIPDACFLGQDEQGKHIGYFDTWICEEAE